LKTQLHAVNACWKRLSQLSLRENKVLKSGKNNKKKLQNSLKQCFSTDGSQPGNGSWKIPNGSRNNFFYFEWLNSFKLAKKILNCGSWKFFFQIYGSRSNLGWEPLHWSKGLKKLKVRLKMKKRSQNVSRGNASVNLLEWNHVI